MAKLGINTGSTANDGTGDTLREAGGKINTNFDEVYSTIGDGTNLFTGIVTNITAGNFISISTSFGDVTITGLANTENINAESLVVTGISTLGLITSVNTLGIGTIFTTRVEATGAIIGDTLVGDGSQITGLATTERVVTTSLVVSGISTLGIVTGATSIGVDELYATSLYGNGSNIVGIQYADVAGIATFATNAGLSTNATFAGYADVAGIATYAPNAGIATNATFAGYSDVAGIATYATNAGVASYAPVSGIATFATSAGIATALNSDSSVNTSGIITASAFVGNLTGNVTGIADTATFATTASFANHATTAGVSSYTSTWIVGEDPTNNSHYRFTGPGVSTDQDDPELYLVRGEVYRFTNQMGRHPIQIQTDINGATGTAYTDGVTGNGVINGDLIFDVQFDAPKQLYYQCTSHQSMGGSIRILNNNSDLAEYADVAGIATYAPNSGIASLATYATNAGVATYAPNAGIASFAPVSGVATVATYAPNAGLSTNATFAGYADVAGIATYAPNAGVATYAPNAGIASYAPLAGLSTNATFAGYATTAGIATFATNAGIASFAPVSGVSTVSGYATNAGLATAATTSNFAVVAGLATVATTANFATNSGVATVATNAQGLINIPDISVGYVLANSGLNVSGVSTLGIVTGATYYGDGSNLSNVLKASSVQSFDNLEVLGVSTLGILTGVQALTTNDLYAGDIVARSVSGDGSGLTSVKAAASVGLELNDVYVGGGFTSIDLRYEGEQVSVFTAIGNTAVITNTVLASTSDTRSNTLVVTGITTLGIVTNVGSIEVVDLYANNVTASNIFGNADGADTILTVTDTSSSSPRKIAFINDIDTEVSNYETVNVGNLTWTPSTGELAGVITYFGQSVHVTDAHTTNLYTTDIYTTDIYSTGIVTGVTAIQATKYYGDGSNLTGTGNSTTVSTNSLVVLGFSTMADASMGDVSMGDVTVTSITGDGSGLTGVASTEDVDTNSLVVSGISTLGVITGASSLEVVDVYSSGTIEAVTFIGDGSQLTGVTKTDVEATSLVVSGISTLGIVTSVPSIGVGNLYANKLYGDGSNITGVEGFFDGITIRRESITVTGIQTTFNFGETYEQGYIDVYLNGIKLVHPTDFSYITSNSIALTKPATDGDVLDTTVYVAGSISSGVGITISEDSTSKGIAYSLNFSNQFGVSEAIDGIIDVTLRPDNLLLDNVVISNNLAASAAVIETIVGLTSITSTNVYATNLYGDGSNLTGVARTDYISAEDLYVSGFTTVSTLEVRDSLFAGVYYGDGSNLTGVSTANVSTDSLVVTGISTLGIVTSSDVSHTIAGSWVVNHDGNTAYTLTGIGLTEITSNPALYLQRGSIYEFNNVSGGAYVFEIRDSEGGNAYNNGVTNNTATSGIIRFEVPFNAPNTLYYQDTNNAGMGNTIRIFPDSI